MSPRPRTLVALALLVPFACGGDDDPGDAAVVPADATAVADASPAADGPVGDAPEGDACGGWLDAGGDAGPDAGIPSSLGPVDCVDDDDCPGQATTCVFTAPGGICYGCGDDPDCPDGLECDTDYGSCIRGCAGDQDCSAGKYCSLGTGRCLIRSCATDPCPYPYECSASHMCQRPPCSGDACPPPMICDGASGRCVEPEI